ncbi:hypothetical protein D3C73_1407700 [compost metagenome]
MSMQEKPHQFHLRGRLVFSSAIKGFEKIGDLSMLSYSFDIALQAVARYKKPHALVLQLCQRLPYTGV